MILFLAVEATMDVNRSRRLNFDAPLLSTKRHVSEERVSGEVPEASRSERVPFCWETAPGLPKNLSLKRDDGFSLESETPRLKLPPGRLKINVHGDDNGRANTDDEVTSTTPAKLRLKKRNTDEDLHHINLEGSFHDAVSEAVDVLSLTQAIDIVEHQRTPKRSVSESDRSRDDSNGYLTIETTEHSSDLSDPSYIIERFLPDAAALAAVTSAAKKPSKNKFGYFWSGQNKRSAVASAVRQSCFSPKGCGLHVLLPTWGSKHRICGVKNAFSPCSHIDLQPRFSPKDK